MLNEIYARECNVVCNIVLLEAAVVQWSSKRTSTQSHVEVYLDKRLNPAIASDALHPGMNVN